MFRTFFRSLIARRPQVQTRSQVQCFRPQLEVLENRLAPSTWSGGGGFSFTDIDIKVVQVQKQIDVGNHNTQVQVVAIGNTLGGHTW